MDIELFFTNADLLQNPASPFHPAFWNMDRWQTVFESAAGKWWVVLLLFLLVLVVFVFVLMMIAHIGLVHAFARYAHAPDTTHTYTLQDAIAVSRKRFGTVALLNLIGRGIVYGCVALTALPLFLDLPNDRTVLLTAALYIVLTAVAVVVSLLTKYAVNYAVLQHTTALVSLQKGWHLFRQNVGVSIEVAVLMSLSYFVTNLAALFVAVLVTLPLLFAGTASTYLLQSSTLSSWYPEVLLVAIIICVGVSTILFSTWQFGNWTLLFLELTKGRRRSKIHRLLKGE